MRRTGCAGICGAASLARREVIARIERRVAEEFVGRAVQTDCAPDLHDDVDLAAAVASERSVVGAGQDFELAHGVHRRRRPPMPFSLGSPLKTPSRQKLFESSRAPLMLMAKSPRTDPAEPWRGRHDARQQQAQLVEIAAVERQALNLAVIDHAADARRIRAHQAAGGGDVHLLGGFAGQQRHFKPHLLVDVEQHGLHMAAIALRFHFQPVRSGREQRDS